jgi:hypothetical protein
MFRNVWESTLKNTLSKNDAITSTDVDEPKFTELFTKNEFNFSETERGRYSS